MSALGDPRDLAARLEALTSPVRLVLFTQTFGCETCFEARRTADEIARLSDRIRVEEHNLVLDAERVAEYGAERAPASPSSASRTSGCATTARRPATSSTPSSAPSRSPAAPLPR